MLPDRVMEEIITGGTDKHVQGRHLHPERNHCANDHTVHLFIRWLRLDDVHDNCTYVYRDIICR